MYEILKSFKQKLIPKFQQKLINFEKPQNLGFKTWNAYKWEKRDIPSEDKNMKMLENHLGKMFGVRKSDLGGEQVRTDRERSRKWEPDHEEHIYRSSVILDR